MYAALDRVVAKYDIKTNLLNLKTLLEDDIVLRNYGFDEYFLTRFLYSSKFDVLVALHKIKEYHDVLTRNPKWFIAPISLNINHGEISDKILINGRDKCGRRILILKIRKLNVRVTTVERQCLIFNMLVERIIHEKLTLENGLCLIIDVYDFPWKLIQWLTLSNMTMGAKLLDNYPIKELIIHLINKSYVVQIGINMLWPFLSSNRKELIKFHFTNWTSLHEYVDPKVLPEEYGGTGPDSDYEETKTNILKDVDYCTAKLKHNMCLRSF